MKQKTAVLFAVCFLLCTQAACGGEETIYLEKAKTGTEISAVKMQDDVETESMDSEKPQNAEGLKECYVYICGAVKAPGVYSLPENSRIYEAVELAGGLTEDAGESSVNQAEPVTDGQMIRILTKEEEKAGGEKGEASAVPESDGRLDLNEATAAQLMELPGIGQSKADNIIAFREKNGGFSSAEEIMNVDGIKEGVYNRIKDRIKVK